MDSLPDMEQQNPWRFARYAVLKNGLPTVGGIGTRPVSDFDKFSPEAELPFCWVRLSQDASIREDRVPKETVLYPRDRAQNCFMTVMKAAGYVNTRLVPFTGKFTMF